MLELLYTGEVTASSTHIQQIKSGLTLLGVLSPSGYPTPPCQQQPLLSTNEEPELLQPVGVINSAQVCLSQPWTGYLGIQPDFGKHI